MRKPRPLVEIVAWGAALLALVQLPGAVLDSVLRKTVAAPATTAALLLLVALLALRWSAAAALPRGRRALASVAVALGLAALLAQLAGVVLLRREVREVEGIGILVPAAGTSNECRGRPSRCHDIVLNELGLRGPRPRRPTADTRLIAFVGDSYVFGAGVGDDDTVPANLNRLLSDLRPPALVVNAGIEGINGGSFPGVIAHLRRALHPDLIAVLLKDDDLDATDKFVRWALFRRSFWYRLLTVTNVETIYETSRQSWRHLFGASDRADALRHYLDTVANAAAGAPLVVVAALGHDLRPTFDAWMAAHPRVAHTASWDNPGFSEAEKIPGDGHWSEAGCARIAAFIAPTLRRELSRPAAN